MKNVLFSILVVCSFMATTAHSNSVSLATLDWPPYIGPSLKNNGYVAEVVEAAFKAVDYKTDVKFMPWARAEAVTTEGEVDALYPEYYGVEREKTHEFSDPFPGGPIGFLQHVDNKVAFDGNLKKLVNQRIGVVRGYVNTQEFDEADYLRKEAVTSDALNIKKIYGKRLDLVVIDKLVAQYIIEKEVPEASGKLEFVEPILEQKDLYIAFSRKAAGYQEKLAAFNKGLKMIKDNGTLQAILEKHNF